LFSRDDVAAFVGERFEPVWISVRPVPIVRIDFGNGRVLTRTLHGNILTSVCDADGNLLDALPGIYEPLEYVRQLEQLRLLHRYLQQKPAEARAKALEDYHDRQAKHLAGNEPPEEFADNRAVAPLTKGRIERSLEVVLRPATKREANQEPVQAKTGTDVAGWKELAEDTRLNEATRRRQIHELLREKGAVKPDVVLKPIYKDVLQADLDDPYLGLGKTLFASYPFAEEDEKK